MENEKRNFYRVWFALFFCFTFVWMVVIFLFSAQPAEASTEISHSVGKRIGQLFIPGFEDMSPEFQEKFSETVDYPVRKTAHASEYAILAVSFCGMFCFLGKLRRQKILVYRLSFLAASFYAVSDEFHQLFVPGRSGQVSDVALDAMGACAGCVMYWMVGRKKTFSGKESG